MIRSARAHLALTVTSPARIALILAAQRSPSVDPRTVETLSMTVDGRALDPSEIAAAEIIAEHGTRLHALDVRPGRLEIAYDVTVTGRDEDVPPSPGELFTYLRPSRYCESDSLGPTARAEFAGLSGSDLLPAVASWVGSRLSYVPGSSLPTDGAGRTLLARRGVCRDYAHLVIALLRAMDVPARLVAVYAPGLSPMDFHAVAEGYVDGAWHVVDATTLAPRSSLVRIATGRDAADTAFLSVYDGFVSLDDMEIGAVADVLPDDDLTQLVRIG